MQSDGHDGPRPSDELVPGIAALVDDIVVGQEDAVGVGISKRGNKHLRKLLIHGARAAMPSVVVSATPIGGWLRALSARLHKNVAVVALANKLARIVWAVLRGGGHYNPAATVTA